MLEYLRGCASDRKLRLFACACCRHIWPYLAEKRSRWIVEISERYADGRVTQERLERAWEQANYTFDKVHLGGGGDVDQNPAQAVVGLGISLDIVEVVEMTAATFGALARGEAYERIWQTPGKANNERWDEDDSIRNAATTAEGQVQATLLRDLFGLLPIGSVAIDSAWLTSDVVALATSIYEYRAFDRLPILADALQEAGCDNEDILTHLRSDGPHVRGCWALDLVLGKF